MGEPESSRQERDPPDVRARLVALEAEMRMRAGGKTNTTRAEVTDWADRLAWIRGTLAAMEDI